MYRIQDLHGEETTYASQEAFARAVRDGQVGPDALIHHTKSDRWILVCLHPDFQSARNAIRPVETLEAPDGAAPETPFWKTAPPGPASRSEEIVEPPLLRHRVLRWGTVMAGIVILSGVGATTWWARIDSPAEVVLPVQAPHELAPAATDSVSGTVTLLPPADSTSLWIQPAAREPLPEASAGSLRNLSIGEAMSALASKMNEDLQSIGFRGLFASERLVTPEQLRAGRRSLQSAGNIVEYYRVEARQLNQEYGGGEGKNSLRPETYAMEQVADSVLGQMDRVLVFLLERQSSYTADGLTIDFENPDDAMQYRALRARLDTLRAEEVAARRADHRAPAPPMAALLGALDSLPRATAR